MKTVKKRLQPNCSRSAQVSINGNSGAWSSAFFATGTSSLSSPHIWRGLRQVRSARYAGFNPYYTSRPQLIYLQRHPKSYIHAIYGPTDALLYPGVDKLIISIDLLAFEPTFNYISKRNIMTDLGVTEENFLDIGILVGFDHSPPFPPSMHEQGLKATVDMVKYYKSGQAAVAAFGDHPAVKTTQYPDQYARSRAMVKYSMILSSEGTVLPLPLAITTSTPPSSSQGNNHHPPPHHHPTAADIPSDLHEIFTHRLPDEIYYYLSRGLLGPQSLVWLTTGQIYEGPPLDNGETTEYRRFVKEVITEGQTGPRATTLALISSVCHNFWANRKVTPYFWFEQPTSPTHPTKALVAHNSPQTSQLVDRVGGWMVPSALVEEELRRQNVSVLFPRLHYGAEIWGNSLLPSTLLCVWARLPLKSSRRAPRLRTTDPWRRRTK